MVSMDGVQSSLILRNESWVRQQAHSLMRRLPSNVEKADLIQAGLIGVAQASISFKWDGDRDSEAAREAFIRFARARVKGAMLDELRQMDTLGRAQRRRVKAVQVARERWRVVHGGEPTMEELSPSIGLSVEEIAALDFAAALGRTTSLSEPTDGDNPTPVIEPATEADEVEARVDTGMLMRRLEKYFATLSEVDRQVIDTYLGVGLSPAQLAVTLKVSPSRVSQLFGELCKRIGLHMRKTERRSTDHSSHAARRPLDKLIDQREAELAGSAHSGDWGQLVEVAFGVATSDSASAPIRVSGGTRWG